MKSTHQAKRQEGISQISYFYSMTSSIICTDTVRNTSSEEYLQLDLKYVHNFKPQNICLLQLRPINRLALVAYKFYSG